MPLLVLLLVVVVTEGTYRRVDWGEGEEEGGQQRSPLTKYRRSCFVWWGMGGRKRVGVAISLECEHVSIRPTHH